MDLLDELSILRPKAQCEWLKVLSTEELSQIIYALVML